jgi:hypothetical protein
MQLDVTAIDLAIIPDDTGADFLIMRMIEASGLIFDVPMKRDQVAAFANSLMGYAG